MTEPKPQIPDEILRSEQKRNHTSKLPMPGAPRVLGLPGLPQSIIDLIVEYGPWLVLVSGVLGGFSAAGQFLVGGMFWTAALGVAAAVVCVLAFTWLREKRRAGWYLAVLGVVIQSAAQLLQAGDASILGDGVRLLIAGYIFMQIRDRYAG